MEKLWFLGQTSKKLMTISRSCIERKKGLGIDKKCG